MRHIVLHADKCVALPILLLCNLQLSFHTIIHRLNRKMGPKSWQRCHPDCILQPSLQNKPMMNESTLTELVIIKGIIREQFSCFSELSLLKEEPQTPDVPEQRMA